MTQDLNDSSLMQLATASEVIPAPSKRPMISELESPEVPSSGWLANRVA